MTVFRPFAAFRYNDTTSHPQDLTGVIAPPYDVLSTADRLALEARDPHNSVRIDFPPGADDPDAYRKAGELLQIWLAEGVLATDARPSFSVYRMTATDETGQTRQTTGVLGGLGLEPPGTGDVLPHEETTSKDKADRFNLIRATQINTSPIWGLSLSAGLGRYLNGIADSRPPLGRATDDEGVVHEVWRVDDTDEVAEIGSLAESTRVVIADGHHRFETGLAYLAERGDEPGDSSAILALLVELAEDQLVVRAIHRLVTFAAPVGPDEIADLLKPFFSVTETERFGTDIVTKMAESGSMTFFTKDRTWSCVARPEAFPADVGLDSTRVRIAVTTMRPDTEIRYHHSVATITDAVDSGGADLGILVRPATVAQIRAVAHDRTRMPAKTTFFWPKPRTGVVFRSVR